MSYTAKAKMGRRKVEAAANIIGNVNQRLQLMESIVARLLERDGLSLAFSKEDGVVLVPTPTDTTHQADLSVKVLDEVEP
jgi:hypothetical protein